MESIASEALPPLPWSSLSPKRALADSDDIDENRRKTPKVSRACDSCKTRKVRCTGTMPCDICTKRGIDCVYNAKYSRGKPRPPPALASDQPSEIPTRRPEPILMSNAFRPINGGVIVPEVESSRSPQEKDSAEILDQVDSPTSTSSFIDRIYDRLLVPRQGSDGVEQPEVTTPAELFMEAGDWDFSLRESNRYTLLALGETAATELLTYYFESCVVTYRMFHRPTVESWLKAAVQGASPMQGRRSWPETIGKAKSAALCTMLAIASLLKHVRQDPTSFDRSKALRKSDEFFCAGASFTDTESGHPSLESAQARLLQVLYLLQSSRMNQAWYLFGTVTQIISTLELYKRPNPGRRAAMGLEISNSITSECRKRTFWVAYVMDRHLSLVFGRPRHFHDEDINQETPSKINDEDLTADTRTITPNTDDCHIDSLISHAELARILGNVSRQVYSAKPMDINIRLRQARRYTEELYRWRDHLPAHLGSVRPSSLIPSFRRQAIALKLAFSYAKMYAHRPFLLHKVGPGDDRAAAERSLDDCLSGAKEIFELYEVIFKDECLRRSSWWADSAIFGAIVVVYFFKTRLGVEISSQDDGLDLQQEAKLFDFAERIHSTFRSNSEDTALHRRYLIILDELSADAKHHWRWTPPGLTNGRSPHSDQHLPNASQAVPDSSSTPVRSQRQQMPSVLRNWQAVDWLELDSLAYSNLSNGSAVHDSEHNDSANGNPTEQQQIDVKY